MTLNLIKVRKSQKEIMMLSIFQKTNGNTLLISALASKQIVESKKQFIILEANST
jgi:hypothetical protein